MLRCSLTCLGRTTALLALLLIGMSSVATAECSEFDPWPKFTDAAPGATHIAIVEVVRIVDEREPDDPRPPLRYRVRTIDNVRGTLPSNFTLSRVWTRDSHPCIPYQLNAAPGDGLALAYGSPHDGIGGWLSAVAFVGHGFHAPSGTNVIDRNYRMQVLSAQAIRRFGTLPATDTGAAADVHVEAAASEVVRWVAMAGAWLWALRH